MNDLKRGIILRDRDTCIYKDIGGLITIQTHTPNCTVIFAKIHLSLTVEPCRGHPKGVQKASGRAERSGYSQAKAYTKR